MRVALIPVEIPKFPYSAMTALLEAEGAAAFDDLTRSGRDRCSPASSPATGPTSSASPASTPPSTTSRPMRARTQAIDLMDAAFQNRRHHRHALPGSATHRHQPHRSARHHRPQRPSRPRRPPSPDLADGALQNAGGPGTPVSLTFLGGLYTEAKLAAFARAYQEATGFHKLHPRLG